MRQQIQLNSNQFSWQNIEAKHTSTRTDRSGVDADSCIFFFFAFNNNLCDVTIESEMCSGI